MEPDSEPKPESEKQDSEPKAGFGAEAIHIRSRIRDEARFEVGLLRSGYVINLIVIPMGGMSRARRSH